MSINRHTFSIIALIILSAAESMVEGKIVVTIQNAFPMVVFPQIYNPSTGSETLLSVHPGETTMPLTLNDASKIWIILRTGCKSDGSGGFHHCITGDCPGTNCHGLARVNDATFIEITQSNFTFTRRVSYVNGCNIANVDVIPFCSGGCDPINCSVDITSCPLDHRVFDRYSGDVVACVKPDKPNQPWLELGSAADDGGDCTLPYGSSYYASRATTATCTYCSSFKVILK